MLGIWRFSKNLVCLNEDSSGILHPGCMKAIQSVSMNPCQNLKLRRCKVKGSCILLRQVSRLKNENRKLRELIHIDPMTGLYNFRSLLETIMNEIKKTARTGEPSSVIMIDLDDFKNINDCYGHIVGDMVLKEVARVIRISVRTSDRVFRYGGEEFTVVLPQTQLDDAIKIAERIRRTIESLYIYNGNMRIKITASLGVSTISNAFLSIHKPEIILDAADKLLLKAKREGKNMVMWESETAEKAEISNAERKAILSLFPPEIPEDNIPTRSEVLQ